VDHHLMLLVDHQVPIHQEVHLEALVLHHRRVHPSILLHHRRRIRHLCLPLHQQGVLGLSQF